MDRSTHIAMRKVPWNKGKLVGAEGASEATTWCRACDGIRQLKASKSAPFETFESASIAIQIRGIVSACPRFVGHHDEPHVRVPR